MPNETSHVRDWAFAGNTYGGLSLWVDADGEHFLFMRDCNGVDRSRPLSEQEVAAFILLSEVGEQ